MSYLIYAPDNKHDYEVKFMKKSAEVKNAFVFPEMKTWHQLLAMTLCVFFPNHYR